MNLLKTAALFAVALLTAAGPAAAAPIFNFVQNGTGDVLATLELTDPEPYGHTDVVDLSFTTEGDAFFGLGAGTFSVPFTRTGNGQAVTDPTGSLISSTGGIVFFETGRSDFVPGPGPNTGDSLGLNFHASATSSEITLNIDYNAGGNISTSGEWTPVPEPATLSLLALGGLAMLRRRKAG